MSLYLTMALIAAVAVPVAWTWHRLEYGFWTSNFAATISTIALVLAFAWYILGATMYLANVAALACFVAFSTSVVTCFAAAKLGYVKEP